MVGSLGRGRRPDHVRMSMRAKVGLFARERPKTTFLLALLALTLLRLLLGAITRTDRERVEDVISGAEHSLEAGDVEGTVAWVAPNYFQEGMDRDALRRFTAKGIATYGSPRTYILRRELSLEADRATCLLSVVVRYPQAPGGMNMLSRSKWRVSLRRAGRRWLITEVSPLEIQDRPIGGLVPFGERFMGRGGGQDPDGP